MYLFLFWTFKFYVYFLLFLFLRAKETKESTKEKKEKTHCFLRLHFVQPCFLFGFAKSLYVRYCATHTLTNCRALFDRREFARLKDWTQSKIKSSAERSEDDENNSVFSFSLLHFLFLCLANKEKESGKQIIINNNINTTKYIN